MDRISICKALAKQNEIDPFFKRMVTGDEKWVTYDNIRRKRSWSRRSEAAQTVAKLGLTSRKVLLSICRRGVVFHQDKPTPHTSVVTRQRLWELDWKFSMHPPYSPDLAPNDYHFFLVLRNFQSVKKLGSREDCENRLLEFSANKGQDFYERGIMKLHLKWQQIIQKKGIYLTEIGQSETT
ncbi:histone-lysine N-methyltransferase SETMAR [Trichonephila clavipes]|nr:histone-lysine N-methyltransferase SETMAR [Trichonephila clavipes]